MKDKIAISVIINRQLLAMFDNRLIQDGFGTRGRSGKIEQMMREFLKEKPLIKQVKGEPEYNQQI